jgi:peptide/nickel transport system permease protein
MEDARALLREAPWLLFFPGMGIMLTVLSLNLIGDGLRDALDPKRARLKAG